MRTRVRQQKMAQQIPSLCYGMKNLQGAAQP